MLIIQGTTDVDVPVELTREVVADLCEQGNSITYLEMPGMDHGDVFYPAGAMVPDWFDARFAGTSIQNNFCEQ